MSVKNCLSIQCCKILFKFLLLMIIISYVCVDVRAKRENEGPLVKRAERKTVISTENGEVSSVIVADGTTGSYHLQFITLEPNSLFLPVVLHSDMVFYVHTGSGKLTWMNENEEKSVDLRIGDVFRLPFGSIFFLESNLDPIRQKLRVYSIFPNSGDDLRESLNGPYSSIRKMVLGFDKKVLQAAFHVPEDVIEEVLAGTEVPAIVHGVPKSTKKKKKNNLWEMEAQFMKTVLGRGSYSFFDNQRNKKKSSKLFNVFQEKPDFENCNGWSTVINRKKLPALKGSQIGIYVVNLTKGSMMGPHWNPMASEIGIAIQGEGMVRVVCSNSGTGQECKNMRFKVEEGDVFVVPRFHPMAQMAFNNNSFVYVGFSTTTKKHHPQYLTGRASVLRTLDRHILEASFNVANTTMHQILEAQGDSVILECTSCAEEEKRLMEEERRREEEEEAKKKGEEERRKEEEEARKAEEEKREKEAEEARKREEEEAKEKEEKRKRQEEEARKREEEEAKRQEEEIRRRQEEEEARKRQEEQERERQEAAQREAEQARREEEEAEKRRQEEEEAKRQEEEKRRQQEEEAEREARRRGEEEAAKRQQEEEAQREAEQARREEEEAKRQEEEKEETKRRQQEEEAEREARRRGEEEAAKRQQEEEAQREAEEAETRRKQEEEESRRQEEESRRREEEAAREAERGRQEEAERQEEEARRQEEETEKRHQQEEEEIEEE
ncbi:vicilin-like seed storage protein At2g18540 [Solanum verrucosum]|uniref:vicilin-like seed storage protein At2g18540 n=1 Tax=Solanum verrucosum TaxID=315347 RepID=UPI0020D0227E|nr:vicilin-like seed storage protein At2g18540 [Solanum verrucosum]